MMNLNDLIQAAAAEAAAKTQMWRTKHIPLSIDGQTFWLTTQMPTEIQEVLNVLPVEKDSAPGKRPHQIKTRLSDTELDSFEVLVKASGLSQADYIRGMVLHGSVNITQTSFTDAKTLETLIQLSADLGKIAGMIRKTIIVNKEFTVLTFEDKAHLEHQIRSLRQLQSYIQTLAEDIHGNT